MKQDDLEKTRKLMQALVRMPPKQHEEMKMGEKKKKIAKKRTPPKRG